MAVLLAERVSRCSHVHVQVLRVSPIQAANTRHISMLMSPERL